MHSTAALILENQGSVDWTQSFDWVADPTYELYELTGAKNMPFWRVLLSPTATYWAVRSFWVGTYYGRLFSGEWWRRTVKGEKNLSQIPLDLMARTEGGKGDESLSHHAETRECNVVVNLRRRLPLPSFLSAAGRLTRGTATWSPSATARRWRRGGRPRRRSRRARLRRPEAGWWLRDK